MSISDLFTYMNLAICLSVLIHSRKVFSMPHTKGRLKVLSVYMILLTIMYVFANVIFLIYKPSIVYLSDLRPVYDCVMLLLFNLSIRHILENSK